MDFEAIERRCLLALGDVCAAARDVTASVFDEYDGVASVKMEPVRALRVALAKLDDVQMKLVEHVSQEAEV